jgi:outer membrane protein assembly factor BamD
MRHSLALFLLLSLTACGLLSSPDEKSDANTASVEKLYADAMDEMESLNFEKAVTAFETLQSHYPYGRYAQQAQLEIAYAYFKQKEPESALAAADRFIKQYPNNPHVDYAYYLKGLINFNADLGLLGGVVSQDLSERDPRAARESFGSFRELVARFPNSQYASDSRLRMQYLVDTLARYEIHVANFYLRRGAYVAALNRAKDVITEYPRTPSTRYALQIMVQAYDAMGMKDLRDDAQRVLNANASTEVVKSSAANSATEGRHWWQFWK